MKNLKRFLKPAFCLFVFLCSSVGAQTLAPGGPGKDAYWSTAGKQAIGTSASLESKVWFTLAQGVMTEVYYPDVTVANVQVLQFVVVNPKTKKVETERDDAVHQIKPLRTDSLSFQQINTAKSGEWKITKTYTTDPEQDSVLIDVRFEPKNKDLNLYVYYDPSHGNTGMHDSATSRPFNPPSSDGFAAADLSAKSASFIRFSSGLTEQTSGYHGVSDGFDQLTEYGKISRRHEQAIDGNVVLMARITNPLRFQVIISFAESIPKAAVKASQSYNKGFEPSFAKYEKGWADYIQTIPKVDPKYQAQFNMAAMVLKAQEDKTVRGANVASLTVPWGGGVNANEDVGGGYHLIWSRDLYHVFTAYLALGNKAAAERALDFLFRIQQKEDGSFPQNSQITGKGGWGSLQMDEVGYPLIMAWQLGRFDKETYEKHVKRAADFIVKNGPSTPQERWEERPGYSPSTIAAEIAGLVCAADIAKRNADTTSAELYLKTADDWQANIEKWTATTKGKYG
ncbi:MAG TPA: glycoside hydrolase family 15 protein, partial [Pyrinomonadaceae bacterium]|nr:glycoside hydrolase family 15 protein [Pyrinomonadaceae bacterium]